MLKFRRRRRAVDETPNVSSLLDRPDLQIRNLLDDPRLRRAMGLDEPTCIGSGGSISAEGSRPRVAA